MDEGVLAGLCGAGAPRQRALSASTLHELNCIMRGKSAEL